MRRPSLSMMVMPVALLASFGCALPTEGVGDEIGTTETGTGTETGTETGTGTGTGTETETGEEPLECMDTMRCNPLDLSDCSEGEVCIFFNTEFQCAPFTGDGSGVAGAPCVSATECNPGLACIQSVFFPACAGGACCSPNCNVDAANTCPNAGEVCDAWMLGEGADPCYVNVGVCITQP
jgi:hypothetical protein